VKGAIFNLYVSPDEAKLLDKESKRRCSNVSCPMDFVNESDRVVTNSIVNLHLRGNEPGEENTGGSGSGLGLQIWRCQTQRALAGEIDSPCRFSAWATRTWPPAGCSRATATTALLIRRNIADGDLCLLHARCPVGTPIKTLVSVEGHR
jgi:hypothetical protein